METGKNKKAASHIGFAIAFVIFIGFVIFILSVIKPSEKLESGKAELFEHLQNKIAESASEDILVVSALESNNANKDCGDIQSLSSHNVATKKSASFYKFYFSDEFQNNNFLCSSGNDYEIGMVRNQSYVLESKINDLISSYTLDYSNLKESLGIPPTNDFEFAFLDVNKAIISSTSFPNEKPETETFAELKQVFYFDEPSAEVKVGYIKIEIW